MKTSHDLDVVRKICTLKSQLKDIRLEENQVNSIIIPKQQTSLVLLTKTVEAAIENIFHDLENR